MIMTIRLFKTKFYSVEYGFHCANSNTHIYFEIVFQTVFNSIYFSSFFIISVESKIIIICIIYNNNKAVNWMSSSLLAINRKYNIVKKDV